jgi:hypothetical protein
MTVGPTIVRMRDAPVGSPTYAWIRPAPIEVTPATKTTQPSHLGYTLLSATARPKRDERRGREDEVEQARQREVDGLVDVDQTEGGGLLARSRIRPLLGELSRGDAVEDRATPIGSFSGVTG